MSDQVHATGTPLADADPSIRVDIRTMLFLKSRLTLGEFGSLAKQIARAAGAKRPSELQRLLLAIVQHQEAAEPEAETETVETMGGVA